jgi:hypothetical protein
MLDYLPSGTDFTMLRCIQDRHRSKLAIVESTSGMTQRGILRFIVTTSKLEVTSTGWFYLLLDIVVSGTYMYATVNKT